MNAKNNTHHKCSN